MTVIQGKLDPLGRVEAAAGACPPMRSPLSRRSGEASRRFGEERRRSWAPVLRRTLALVAGFAFLVYLVGLTFAPKFRARARNAGGIRRVPAPSPVHGPRTQA
jgi:hypothetical protein